MYLELDGHGGVGEQLARALKRAILQGQIGVGSKLPATRELATELRLSRNTVVTAYELLATEGLTAGRAGSGTYVAQVAISRAAQRGSSQVKAQSRYSARTRKLPPLALARQEPTLRYDLQYGEPMLNPPLLNRWRTELARAAVRTEQRYPPVQGLMELRVAISEYLARRRGVLADPADIVIVNGTQQALSLTARVLLDEGDTAVIEEPHYQLALFALRAHGARVLGVPTDAQGLVVDALPRHAPRLVHVTPSHQFPGGSVMSPLRRAMLLQYAIDHGCWIFEDDYDAEFRYDSRPIPALRSLDMHDRVIYAGSFSKSLLPSMRMGYLVCPAGLRPDLVAAKRMDDLGCSAVEQVAMASLIRNGGFETHLRKASAELRRRRRALMVGLARHCGDDVQVIDSNAGMHAVGWLPRLDRAGLDRLIDLAASRNLRLHPIHPHYLKPPARVGLLFGFAALSVQQLAAATAILGRCLDEVAR